MGEVYRATDTKLGRDVALKVLPVEMASRPDRLERFRREAKALAALDHPGIVTVFSVEEADGVHFLTMQLVEGQPLDRLIPEGGMPLDRLAAIGGSLAEALAAAHAKGIVHRDLKPANVMATAGGGLKILDFGLARIGAPADGGSSGSQLPTDLHTREGVVMGTVPYMSPEQVAGREVDHRTDLFSLGVMLYEMATGRRPFRGESSAEVASAILRDAPPPLASLRQDLPSTLANAIERCLGKSAGERFGSARELRDALRGASPAPTSVASNVTGARAAAKADSGAGRAKEGFWVAVLPFRHRGADPGVEALAEGLTEDVVTGLSRFSYLRVIARGSTAQYSAEGLDVRDIGRELGARYVIEGSVRQAGSTLRVAVQLVDAATGAHLWAETYDRSLSPEGIFALQDDLVPRIVSTVADWYGILPRSMSEAVRTKPVDQLDPYEALLRAFGYYERVTPEEHAAARPILERALDQAPGHAAAWAMLSMLYGEEHRFGFNAGPDPLGRALQAARRAVEAAPSSHFSHLALAQAHYFRREIEAFHSAAERAIALNPLDGATIEYLAHLIAFSGDWERGIALGERGRQLNPHHPAWYWALPFLDAYRRGDYGGARAFVGKVLMPGQYYSHALLAALHAQLGEREAAGEHLFEATALRPDLARIVREQFGKWYPPQLVESLMDGLRKAGLGAPAALDSRRTSAPSAAVGDRSAAPAPVDAPWIAVLPFKAPASSPELAALAEGLGEDITSGLARFSHLSVVSRQTVVQTAGRVPDLHGLGRELGARYALEGTIRRSGTIVRVGVQLSDVETSTHLWTETYDRDLASVDAFALQDDVTDRVVATVADPYGALVRSMARAIRQRPVGELTASELVLRFFAYWHQTRADEHALLRDAFEAKLEREPGHADAWACLARVYSHELMHGLNPRPGSTERALAAARRAVEIDAASQMAWESLADASFGAGDVGTFRAAADRAMALNPRNSNTAGSMAVLLALSGERDRGAALARRAADLNPHHPGWYEVPLFVDHYLKGEYEEALRAAKRIQMADFATTHVFAAAASGRLQNREEARLAVTALHQRFPDYRRELLRQEAVWSLDGGALLESILRGLAEAEALVSAPSGPTSRPPDSRPPDGVAIAVLPFADLSQAKDQQYLCEGMAEEIMSALVRVPGIHVASRTSAFRARQEGRELADVARALSVGHVLEGSVRAAGRRLRVTAQLTDAQTGYQLWSERFDRDTADVFALQDEIAAGVVDAVRARLAPGATVVEARPRVANVEAYQRYLMGRHLRYTRNDHGGAVREFGEAVRLDPGHAPSWIGLAEANVLATFYALAPIEDARAAAREALATAARLGGESADAASVAGLLAFSEQRWAAAEQSLRRAVELRPDLVQARCWLAQVLAARGRAAEAAAHSEKARASDPLAPYPYAMSGVAMLRDDRRREAIAFFEQALAFEPGNTLALWGLGTALVAERRHEEGVSAFERALTAGHRGGFIHGGLGWALAEAGRTAEALAVLEELRRRPEKAPTAVSEAWLLAALGRTDEAFDVLERAHEERQPVLGLIGLQGFDRLRPDRRFAALLERLGLPDPPRGSATAE